jgi:hypothetical protein
MGMDPAGEDSGLELTVALRQRVLALEKEAARCSMHAAPPSAAYSRAGGAPLVLSG